MLLSSSGGFLASGILDGSSGGGGGGRNAGGGCGLGMIDTDESLSERVDVGWASCIARRASEKDC